MIAPAPKNGHSRSLTNAPRKSLRPTGRTWGSSQGEADRSSLKAHPRTSASPHAGLGPNPRTHNPNARARSGAVMHLLSSRREGVLREGAVLWLMAANDRDSQRFDACRAALRQAVTAKTRTRLRHEPAKCGSATSGDRGYRNVAWRGSAEVRRIGHCVPCGTGSTSIR